MLSRLKKKDKVKTPSDDEVLVLTIYQELFACALLTNAFEVETIGESKSLFVPFISEVCMMADIIDNEKVKIPTLTEIIIAQSTDWDCRIAFASVGKPDICFNTDSDGVLVRVFLGGASQRVAVPPIRPCCLHLCKYSLLTGHPGESHVFDSMRRKL